MTESEYTVAFLAQLGIKRTEITVEMLQAIARFRDHILTEATPKAELRWVEIPGSIGTTDFIERRLQQKWASPGGDVWRDVPVRAAP